MTGADHDPESASPPDATDVSSRGATVEQALPGGATLRYREASQRPASVAHSPRCPLCEAAAAAVPKDDPLVCMTCRLSRQSETHALTLRRHRERLADLGNPSVPRDAALAALAGIDGPPAAVSRRGRREGTGTFANREEFRDAVAAAVIQLKGQGLYPTQARVAEFFGKSSSRRLPKCRDRQMRRWLKQFGCTWEGLLSEIAAKLKS
jgi:hypothetical protein